MSRKQVLILWVIAVVLAGSAIGVKMRSGTAFDTGTARSRGQTLFAEFPAKDVARLQVTSGGDTSTLVRKDGKWTIAERDGYPANVTAVNELIRQIAEARVVAGIQSKPVFAPRFGMDPSSSDEEERGITAAFSNEAGEEIARVTFGKILGEGQSGEPAGKPARFIRNDRDESGVYRIAELFSSLSASPSSWLDQKFLSIGKITSISVTQPDFETVDWKLSRTSEDGEFTLEGLQEGETLDPGVITPLKSLFSSSRFEDIIPQDKVAAMEQKGQKRKVHIVTSEGFDYRLTIVPAVEEAAKGPEAPPQDSSYLVTVELSATLPAERKKGEAETEEEAKQKDAAFAEQKAALEKKLAEQQAFAGRTYKVTSWTVEAVMKNHAELVKKAEEAAGAPGGNAAPQGFPGGIPSGLRRPAQAVTPPVQVPPAEAPPAPAPPAEAPPAPAPPAEAPPAPAPPAEESREGE